MAALAAAARGSNVRYIIAPRVAGAGEGGGGVDDEGGAEGGEAAEGEGEDAGLSGRSSAGAGVGAAAGGASWAGLRRRDVGAAEGIKVLRLDRVASCLSRGGAMRVPLLKVFERRLEPGRATVPASGGDVHVEL